MKTLIITSAIALSGLFYNTAHAQIGVRVGFDFGTRPVYAPAPPASAEPVYQDDAQAGYDDDYYYLPDVDAYYSVDEECYYYNDGDNWISAAYLPGYRGFDWRNARRFEVRGRRPYMHNDYYRARFGGPQGHFESGYANAGRFNQGFNRAPEQHFDNRGWGGDRNFQGGQFANRGAEQFNQNRGFDRGQQFNQRQDFDRGQQFNQNRGGDRGRGQQYNQNQGNDRNQQFNQNRGGDRGQQFNQNQGNDRGQQFNQNRGGDRGDFGGQHFAQNNDHGGHFNGGDNGHRH